MTITVWQNTLKINNLHPVHQTYKSFHINCKYPRACFLVKNNYLQFCIFSGMKIFWKNKRKINGNSTSGILQSVTDRRLTWKYTRTTTPAVLYREVTTVAEVHRLTGLLRLRIVTVLSSPRDQLILHYNWSNKTHYHIQYTMFAWWNAVFKNVILVYRECCAWLTISLRSPMQQNSRKSRS